MSRIFVITSGKGGVGKTTTSINLAAALNYFNEDVLIIDGNLTTPNVGIHLGSPEVPITLNHILLGKASPEEAVYEHESGIKIMPSSLSIKELKKIKQENLKKYSNEFKEISDTIIVDCAAGLGEEAKSAIELADEIIIVTNPELPAVTDALKTIKYAQGLKKPIKGIIVTRVKKNDYEMQPIDVKEMLEEEILGMIPEDSSIQEALNFKNAVVHTNPSSNASRAYKEIASKILDIEYDSSKDKEKFWIRFIKKIRLKN